MGGTYLGTVFLYFTTGLPVGDSRVPEPSIGSSAKAREKVPPAKVQTVREVREKLAILGVRPAVFTPAEPLTLIFRGWNVDDLLR